LEIAMRTATTALRLEPDLKHRAEVLAAAEQRTFSAVVRDALQMYLVQREAEQAEIREAVASWEEYQQTGLHVTGDEMSAWLRSWGTDNESEPPECHL
jgi:predicted transcriptional regulator